MKPFNKSLTLFVTFFSALQIQAQNTIAMADLMREEGKIYVVVAVILIIFLVLAAFLVYLDKKISKLENKER